MVHPPPSVLTTTSACFLEMDLMGATSRTTFTCLELRPMVVDLLPASATMFNITKKTQERGEGTAAVGCGWSTHQPFLIPAYRVGRIFGPSKPNRVWSSHCILWVWYDGRTQSVAIIRSMSTAVFALQYAGATQRYSTVPSSGGSPMVGLYIFMP